MNLSEQTSRGITSDSHRHVDARALRTVRHLFPRDESLLVPAWLAYDTLARESIRVRRQQIRVARRLVQKEIVQYDSLFLRPAASTQDRGEGLLAAIGKMEALFVYLLDVSLELRLPPASMALPRSMDSVTVPSNAAGTSCFCDVVLVAMFLATDRYDAILARENTFVPAWDRMSVEMLEDISVRAGWPRQLFGGLEASVCYLHQLNIDPASAGANTLKTAERIRSVLSDNIVRRMRAHAPGVDHAAASLEIGESVSDLRLILAGECGRGSTSLQEDDASDMFLTLLGVGSWGPLFLPVILETRVDVFEDVVGRDDLFRNVPPLVRTNIKAPELPRMDFAPGFRSGDSLQRLVDDNFLSDVRSEELVVVDPTRPGHFAQYLFASDPSMYDANASLFASVGFRVVSNTSHRFARVPAVLAFSIARGVPGPFVQEGERVFTRVMLPAENMLHVSMLDDSDDAPHRVTYRIVAIACHIGKGPQSGHYILYFRYAETGRWYRYNDISAAVDPADVNENVNDRTTVEENGYLFWAVQA